MRFCVLGSLSVLAGGRREVLARGQRRTILAVLLAAEGATVTTDVLIDGLWGTDPPATARKSLQSHVSRVRQELEALAPDEPTPVVTEPDGYRVNLTDHELDAARFTALVNEARHGARDDDVLVLLQEAEDCWHGPAFGDLAAHPAVAPAARRLDQQRMAATADRVDALLAAGRHDEALDVLPGVIDHDPFDERAHGQLMCAQVAAGRQADALATFRALQDRLRDELGVDPSSELRHLHEQILRQEGAVVGTASRRAAPPVETAPSAQTAPTVQPARPVHTAPVRRPDPLLGRDRDIKTLATWVRGAALVTLTGPGGVGKTRLAERVVEEIGGAWRDGAITCAFAHVRDEEGVGGALVTALAIQPSGQQTVSEALVSALGDRQLLLFLDNCEHVIEGVLPLVEAILSGCPAVTILATSRERLRLSGEHVWPVTPLDVPTSGADVHSVLETSAGALFQLRAEAVDPGFTVTRGNAAAVAELCRRLDGMPLAIELAAARSRALAPSALVDRLDERFAVLAGGPRHEGGRHRTLEAVVSWSYDLLAPEEADLFDRLAVFAGAVPLTTVEEVCSDERLPRAHVAGLLGELVDQSMVVVQRDGEQVRYRLLDTMREFGMRRLEERGIVEDLRCIHARHHVALAEVHGVQGVRGPDEPVAVEVLDRAMDDLRAAHTWAVSSGDVDTALRLPAALADEVVYRLRDEVTSWARRAVAMPAAREHPAHAAALVVAAWGATSRDECDRAVSEATAVLARTEPSGQVEMIALGVLATAALYEGRLDDVLAFADQQEELAAELDDDCVRTYAWVCRVLALLYRGEVDEAAAGVPELRRFAARSGSPTRRAFARYCDGEVHLERDPDHAAATLQEAVTLARSVGNRLLEGVSLVCLASSQGRRGHTQQALQAFREVVVHWRRVGDHTHQLTTLRNLVELLAEIGDDDGAAILYGAVTGGDTPSYGAEAERLVRAWEQVSGRLEAETAERLVEQGRGLNPTRMAEEALTRLDSLLTG